MWWLVPARWWSSLERWLPVDSRRARERAYPHRGSGDRYWSASAGCHCWQRSCCHRHPPHPATAVRSPGKRSVRHGDIFLADLNQAVPETHHRRSDRMTSPAASRDGTKLAFLRKLSEHTTDLMLGEYRRHRHQTDPSLSPLTDMDWYEWSAKDDRLATVSSIGGRRTLLSIVDVGHDRDTDRCRRSRGRQ